MNFLSSIFLSASCNFDTLKLSHTFNKKSITIYKYNIICISIITTLATCISMYVGNLLSTLLIKQYSNIFGGMLLSFIGLNYYIEYIKAKEDLNGFDTSYYVQNFAKTKNNFHILESSLSKNSALSLNKSMLVSYYLLSDNIILGFAGGIAGINLIYTIFFNFIISIFIFIISNFLKLNENNFIIKYKHIINGTLLLILGLFSIFS